jgi:hypothetical protein
MAVGGGFSGEDDQDALGFFNINIILLVNLFM